MNKNIWILGEYDNEITNNLVNKLQSKFKNSKVYLISISPYFKRDLKRLFFYIKRNSFFNTYKKSLKIFRRRKDYTIKKKNTLKNNNNLEIIFVKKYNSKECLNLIKDNSVEFLLSLTDEIIPSKLLLKIKKGIWNVHPAALPYYRGVMATDRMISDGFFPILTAHMIDEGVDTGPCLFEYCPDYSNCETINHVKSKLKAHYTYLYIKIVNHLINDKKIVFRDDFMKISNIAYSKSSFIKEIDFNNKIINLKYFNKI